MDSTLETFLADTGDDTLEYRPVIHHLPADEAALKNLFQSRPAIRVSDHIKAQVRELVKSLNPSLKLSTDALEDKANNHLGNRKLAEYGSWVFYPWSDRLVHVLDESEFALVRTDRNRNKITREEQAVLATKKIGVIGLSVGQSVSLTMALERGFGEIRLADFDTLDLSNLNRIRSGTHALGSNKAIVTAREIAELDPYLKVVCFTEGLTKENMDAFFTEGGQLDILVEECDSVDIKILARQKAKALGIPVVMDMSDRGCLDVERFDLEPDRPLLHGWIDHLDLDAASRPMSAEEKVPYMLPITGVETLSPRMKASVIELGQTISTWPQLATSVVLGGALAGDAVRRIALGEFNSSGRWHVDLEELVADPKQPPPPPRPAIPVFTPNIPELAKLAVGWGPVQAAAVDLDGHLVEELITAAIAAPSAGNRQPWHFLRDEKRLLVMRDPHRGASIWDPDHMMTGMALGACLENIVLKASALGFDCSVHAQQDLRQEVAAWLEFVPAPAGQASPQPNARLAAMIPERCTDRSIGRPQTLSPAVREQLVRATAPDGICSMHWIDAPDAMAELAELYSATERLRLMHPEGHREYFSELIYWGATNGEARHDGLYIGTFGLPPMAEAALKVMADPRAMDAVRSWKGGQGLGRLPYLSVSTSSAAVLLSTSKDDPADWLDAGRCMQRFWLACTADGWAVQPLSSLIALRRTQTLVQDRFSAEEQEQVSSMATRLQRLFSTGGTEPVILLRVFRSARRDAHLRSRRRPIDHILHTLNPYSHERHTG